MMRTRAVAQTLTARQARRRGRPRRSSSASARATASRTFSRVRSPTGDVVSGPFFMTLRVAIPATLDRGRHGHRLGLRAGQGTLPRPRPARDDREPSHHPSAHGHRLLSARGARPPAPASEVRHASRRARARLQRRRVHHRGDGRRVPVLHARRAKRHRGSRPLVRTGRASDGPVQLARRAAGDAPPRAARHRRGPHHRVRASPRRVRRHADGRRRHQRQDAHAVARDPRFVHRPPSATRCC